MLRSSISLALKVVRSPTRSVGWGGGRGRDSGERVEGAYDALLAFFQVITYGKNIEGIGLPGRS